MKIRSLFLLFFFSVSVHSLFAQRFRDGDKIDGIAAVVGKYAILKLNIDIQVQAYLAQSSKPTTSPDTIAKLRDQILQNEIDQKVLLVRAEQDSTIIPPTEAEIDERLNDRIKQYER